MKANCRTIASHGRALNQSRGNQRLDHCARLRYASTGAESIPRIFVSPLMRTTIFVESKTPLSAKNPGAAGFFLA